MTLIRIIFFSAATDFSLARILSICGPSAYKNNNQYFGGNSKGDCLTTDETKTTMTSSSFSNVCLPESQDIMQYHIFTIMKK